VAPLAGIGDGPHGPVAESVDARAVHRSLSWFKSRPGLQPSLLRSFGSASRLKRRLPRHSSKSEGGLDSEPMSSHPLHRGDWPENAG